MLNGMSIRIHLMDGDAEGRLSAEFVTRVVRAYKIPRTKVLKSGDLDDLHTPAVYFLLGDDDTGKSPEGKRVYIGETEDPLERFGNHLSKKDWWNEAIILVASNGFLNKAHVKYLESRFTAIAGEASRYEVDYSRDSNQPKLTKADIDELEGFIADARLLIPTLGHRFLEPFVKKTAPTQNNSVEEADGELFYLRRDMAVGKRTNEGFVVLKGAKIKSKLVPSAADFVKNSRDKYQNLIVD
ncbi:MAG: GIY-YIG nuclease family protein, partial [Oscillospiraceae bacterium]|nr:GIY-YIG nuclease family protein [Oscillospiraceae bacterium]